MRAQDEKAVLTKKIRRYQRKKTSILKITFDGGYVLITPGSERIFMNTDNAYPERLEVPPFSDYAVRNGLFSRIRKEF